MFCSIEYHGAPSEQNFVFKMGDERATAPGPRWCGIHEAVAARWPS
jgi:hypothetical protein